MLGSLFADTEQSSRFLKQTVEGEFKELGVPLQMP